MRLLSVTLRYCGHVVWVISKTVTCIARPWSSISAAANIISVVQGEHSDFSGGTGVGYGKSGCSPVQRVKAVMSLKYDKIERKLLLTAYIK